MPTSRRPILVAVGETGTHDAALRFVADETEPQPQRADPPAGSRA